MKKNIRTSPEGKIPGFPNKILEGSGKNGNGKKSEEKPKSKRGFAAQSPEKLKEIASKGGKKSRGGGRTPKSGVKKTGATQDIKPAENVKKLKRGFAAMDESKRKSIASMGGKISKGGGRPSNSSKKTAPKKTEEPTGAKKTKLMAALGAKTEAKPKKK